MVEKTTQDNSPAVVLNGNYSRLMDPQSQSESVQLKQNDSKSLSNNQLSQQKKTNGEAKIRMADEDIDDEETLLTHK